ncbi:hypothetical protein EK403_08180 [Hansschlegelia zhihuaiae]|uniref:Uncharacterized protein n=1 Tax=Hansschlegelia zhihuaiae TaxID=405005 RepID=A0A4Q0MLJ5_9HYPH|nr:hypothetical protein EK403_08180 [Hansschlegelia zhihuaiae]
MNCTVADKGGGDAWLQAALGRSDSCFRVDKNYYIFINSGGGIPKDGYVSVKLPWWSKRTKGATDLYIDWWRGGRVIIFDDRTALNEVYKKLSGNAEVAFAAGSPRPDCNDAMKGNFCNNVRIFEVTQDAEIDPHLPFQLNEFTFADVSKVTDNGKKGGEFIDFNQNYNVSNVDQVYLPLAIEPVREPADVGYMGATMAVGKFRKLLEDFTETDNTGKLVWPVYNNPVVNGRKAYPDAGVRVPSAQSALAFYMNPFVFPDGKTPTIVPKDPPKLIKDMMDQWSDCTVKDPKVCAVAQSDHYKSVDAVFLKNYKKYVDTCNRIPAFLKPVSNNPPKPKLTAYLTFIYGWVPFNVACPNDELPVVDDLPPDSRSVIDYFQMQYNYDEAGLKKSQRFNPYTQLIHDDVAAGGLSASAYAFSIDDHASFLSNSGGSTPGGLIFAVGGPGGLKNGKPHAPPVPAFYKWYDFSIGLGEPAPGAPFWTKYGMCSAIADTTFPTESKSGWVLGVDPALIKIGKNNPCPITLQDSENRKYRFVVQKASDPGVRLPQTAIWPAFAPSAGRNFDPNVLACPAVDGFVAPGKWCVHINEVARPAPNAREPGFYTLGAPPPVAK